MRVVCAALLATVLLAGCSTVSNYAIVAKSPPPTVTPCTAVRHQAGIYVGVSMPGFPPSAAAITKFEHTTDVRPNLIEFYSRFGDSFDASAACYAVMHGAMPVIQIDPDNTPLSGIVDGKYDYYLRAYASAIKEFKGRIVVGFGDELNGQWYRWGWTNPPARLYVAAWRRIVSIFRAEGAINVTWLWTINMLNGPGAGLPRPWWPGRQYVNWVGIDGYYYRSADTFSTLIAPTITAVRAFTRKQVLVAETGASPAAGKAAKIFDLFAGIHAYGLLGLVWSDADENRNWSIESGSAAAVAFRRAAHRYAPGTER